MKCQILISGKNHLFAACEFASCVVRLKFKANAYTYKGTTESKQFFCFSSENGSGLGSRLFNFRLDPFTEGGRCAQGIPFHLLPTTSKSWQNKKK